MRGRKTPQTLSFTSAVCKGPNRAIYPIFISFWAVSLAAGLLLATPAFADTITFGSYVGTSAPGLANGVVTYNNTGAYSPQTSLQTGTVSSLVNGWYAGPLPGTSWVSYDPNSNAGDNSGVTMYSTSYTGNLAGYAGSISVIGDDDMAVYLNNVFIGSTGYNSPTAFNFASGTYINGTNTFVFDVYNNTGTTGFHFSGTAVAVTPEPGSLLLLGTDALYMVGAARRRFPPKSKAAPTSLP